MRTSHIVLLVLAGVLLLCSTAAGYSFYSAKKEEARLEALREREVAESKAQLQRITAQLEELRVKIAAAEAELASAQTDVEREYARAKLEAAREEQRKIMRPTTVGIPPIRRHDRRSTAPCKCQPGDPLCTCL